MAEQAEGLARRTRREVGDQVRAAGLGGQQGDLEAGVAQALGEQLLDAVLVARRVDGVLRISSESSSTASVPRRARRQRRVLSHAPRLAFGRHATPTHYSNVMSTAARTVARTSNAATPNLGSRRSATPWGSRWTAPTACASEPWSGSSTASSRCSNPSGCSLIQGLDAPETDERYFNALFGGRDIVVGAWIWKAIDDGNLDSAARGARRRARLIAACPGGAPAWRARPCDGRRLGVQIWSARAQRDFAIALSHD